MTCSKATTSDPAEARIRDPSAGSPRLYGGNYPVLPSLTQLACDTRKSVFSHAHTPIDKNLTRTGKNIPNSYKTYIV